MSHSLGKNLFLEMMNADYIHRGNQFKTGMLINNESKRLLIKQVFPKKSPSFVDVFIQYAHVVTINGQPKFDPGVVLGFDLKNQEVHPILYRNDLLDHSIHVFQNGEVNEANAEWLLEYFTGWFGELKSHDYDYVKQKQAVA